MSADDLEQRLARTPLRPPSPAWREEILAAAHAAHAAHPAAPAADRSRLPGISQALEALRRAVLGLMSPSTVLACAAFLVLLLHGLGVRLDKASPLPSAPAPAFSWPALVHAVRDRQSAIAALVSPGDTDLSTPNPSTPDPGDTEPHARSRWHSPGITVHHLVPA